MALTESNMMALGSVAPNFALTDGISDDLVQLSDFSGRPLLVMFICNHCPYVIHVQPELVRLGEDYAETDLAIVAIQSNDVTNYPQDSPERMKEVAARLGYRFPYLYDRQQFVAKAFSAACTPDFFLFDSGHRLAYRGQLDETRPKRIESGVYDSTENQPHGKDLRAAIDAVLSGGSPQDHQLPSIGCNIKWIG